MEEIKYILTDEKTNVNGRTVYRIQAIKDFGDVKAGDLGGWIEKEENLSHGGLCWVYPDACACECSYISNDAKLHARVIASGKCTITDHADISGNVRVSDCAYISGSPRIRASHGIFSVIIGGRVCITSDTTIESSDIRIDREQFGKHAQIFNEVDYLCVGPIGSRCDYTTFYRTKDHGIWVFCGCFNGSIDDFKKKVKESHPFGSQFRAEYLDAIRIAKTKIRKGVLICKIPR